MEADYDVIWYHKDKNVIQRQLSPNLLHAITSHAAKTKHNTDYQIEGCTEIRICGCGGLLYIDAQRDIEVMSGMTSPWYRIQLDQKHILDSYLDSSGIQHQGFPHPSY